MGMLSMMMMMMMMLLMRMPSCCHEIRWSQLSGSVCRAGVPTRRAAMVAVGVSSHLVELFPLTVDQMDDGRRRAGVRHKISPASAHTDTEIRVKQGSEERVCICDRNNI